jgi:hypothetical protein
MGGLYLAGLKLTFVAVLGLAPRAPKRKRLLVNGQGFKRPRYMIKFFAALRPNHRRRSCVPHFPLEPR